jgi:hypothetical protein
MPMENLFAVVVVVGVVLAILRAAVAQTRARRAGRPREERPRDESSPFPDGGSDSFFQHQAHAPATDAPPAASERFALTSHDPSSGCAPSHDPSSSHHDSSPSFDPGCSVDATSSASFSSDDAGSHHGH